MMKDGRAIAIALPPNRSVLSVPLVRSMDQPARLIGMTRASSQNLPSDAEEVTASSRGGENRDR